MPILAIESLKQKLSYLRYGYSVIPFPVPDLALAVLRNTELFFGRDEAYKNSFNPEKRMELGYSAFPHKEAFNIRNSRIPIELDICKKYIEVIHHLAIDCLHIVAQQIQLPFESISSLISKNFFNENKDSDSLLRLIHYYQNENESVAGCTAHQDLGLLTLVLRSNAPALEIYDCYQKSDWVHIESEAQPLDLIVMAGESLSFITNEYYVPATHRVRNTPLSRLGVVYQLRMCSDAIIDSQNFETAITKNFSKPFKTTAQAFLANEMSIRTSVNGSY